MNQLHQNAVAVAESKARHDAHRIACHISLLVVRSLYQELALHPKPGLVSFRDNGAHRDMNAATFVRSLFSLRGYFFAIAAAGMREETFNALQQLGVAAETRMLRATRGINTLRGAIFTLGILAAAAGCATARKLPRSDENLRAIVIENWSRDLRAIAVSNAATASHGQLMAVRHASPARAAKRCWLSRRYLKARCQPCAARWLAVPILGKHCCILSSCCLPKRRTPTCCFAAGIKDCASFRRRPQIFSSGAACSKQDGRGVRNPCIASVRYEICRRVAAPTCWPRRGSYTSCRQANYESLSMSLAILCSGQSAQHPAMLDLIADHPAAAEVIKSGDAELGLKLRDVLAQGEDIFRNAIAQPLICITQLALWSALRQDAPKPAAFCGYSVGELAAYAYADAIGTIELARIAASRAALMNQAATVTHSGMLALQGLCRGEVASLCEGQRAWIAIAIGAEEFVIGGEDAALQQLSTAFAERGAKLTRLKVGLASHTPLLSGAVGPFRAFLNASSITAPATPVVAGIDAAWVVRRETAIEKLAQQLDRTIEWSSCLDMLYERGCRVFLELGPGRALARMAQARFPDVDARSVDDFRSLDGVSSWLSKHARVL